NDQRELEASDEILRGCKLALAPRLLQAPLCRFFSFVAGVRHGWWSRSEEASEDVEDGGGELAEDPWKHQSGAAQQTQCGQRIQRQCQRDDLELRIQTAEHP